ncbi:hypothetical protein vseg_019784 [Gypsophila vaccaria]
MESSNIIDNDSSSISDSRSTIVVPLAKNNNICNNIVFPLEAKASESLCRMGSGMSVVIDSENGVETESRKLPSSKYKGVVPQPNGRWGAQIYEKHQRVWLGTFNGEDEAARAYDVAAQRFRGRDAVTNFKPLSLDEESGLIELRFVNSKSKAEVVDMLRKHTYYDELQQSRRSLKVAFDENTSSDMGNNVGGCWGMISLVQLFEKVVTPSDVGKLNRLVIPKQHAEKHFPLDTSGKCSSTSKGVLLNFKDADQKVWRFRYSYWNSSQSYVLTKGWSRFVKEKNLHAGDVVCFQRSNGSDNQLYIDFQSRTGSTNNRSESGSNEEVLGQADPTRTIRLFGVDICKVTSANANENDKRFREIELLGIESLCKKTVVIA